MPPQRRQPTQHQPLILSSANGCSGRGARLPPTRSNGRYLMGYQPLMHIDFQRHLRPPVDDTQEPGSFQQSRRYTKPSYREIECSKVVVADLTFPANGRRWHIYSAANVDCRLRTRTGRTIRGYGLIDFEVCCTRKVSKPDHQPFCEVVEKLSSRQCEISCSGFFESLGATTKHHIAGHF